MAAGVLRPEDVGPADAARVLGFLNGATDAAALAGTIGFSEGMTIGRQVAEAIVQRRASGGAIETLDALLAVTGVNLARFTEIVMALSGARPSAAGWTMRLMPGATRPWLGQSVPIVGQLLDSSGLGVPGAEVSCIASSGLLSAPNSRGELQRGAAVRLTTEPAGIVRLDLHPALTPALDRDSATALASELARLGTETDGPAAVAPALAAFAARYRADASSALREAVDRLFAAYPVDTPGVGSSWPVETVTIMAIAEDGSGQPTLAGTAVMFFRNWLGAWLAELAGAVRSDRSLDQALAQFEVGASEADAARGLVLTTQAFAKLEHGVLGGRERDKLLGLSANRFLERVGGTLAADALENVVRAAGATDAATAAGGFAVFDAIQTVQNVSETIGPKRVDPKVLGVLDGRLSQLEATATDISIRTDTKLADFGGKVAALEADRVTKAQLAGLETRFTQLNTTVGTTRNELTAQISAKADKSAVTVLDQSFKSLVDGRLAQLEARAVDKATLDGLRNDLVKLTDDKVAAVNVKVASLESDRVTKAQLAGLETRFTQFESDRVTKAQLAGLETRFTQLNTAIGSTRSDLLAQINAKADQAAVVVLNQSVSKLQTDNERFSRQVKDVDFDVFRTTRTPRGPSR